MNSIFNSNPHPTPTPPPTDPHWHTFSVYRIPSSASKRLVTASDPHHTPLFYVSPSLYAGKTHRPDVTLHRIQPRGLNASESADGRKLSAAEAALSPVVATAHFRHTGKKIGLAFGDPGTGTGTGGPTTSAVQNVHWEQMVREKVSKGRYAFSMPPRDAVYGGHGFGGSCSKRFVSDFQSDPGPKVDFGDEVDHVVHGAMRREEAGRSNSSNRNSCKNSCSTSSSSSWWEPKINPSNPPVRSRVQHRAGSDATSSSTTTATEVEGRRMTWKRTHSTESGLENAALYRVASAANFKLVDDATGAVVALFESNGLKSFRKLGRLRISREWSGGGVADGMGDDGKVDEYLLLCVVLTHSVIDEQMRRD